MVCDSKNHTVGFIINAMNFIRLFKPGMNRNIFLIEKNMVESIPVGPKGRKSAFESSGK